MKQTESDGENMLDDQCLKASKLLHNKLGIQHEIVQLQQPKLAVRQQVYMVKMKYFFLNEGLYT